MATFQPGGHVHRRRRLTGRDPAEVHRGATPLELFFDLTIVVAIGIAADELAQFVADDHVRAGVIGFAFAAFAVIWAWIQLLLVRRRLRHRRLGLPAGHDGADGRRDHPGARARADVRFDRPRLRQI
jgi:hypothetical protein